MPRYDFDRSFQYRRLEKCLRLPRVMIIGHVHLLEGLVASDFPDGCIHSISEYEIEEACDWTGQPGQLLAAFLDAFLLVRQDRCYALVDWLKRAPDYVKRKIRQARKDETPASPAPQPRLPFPASPIVDRPPGPIVLAGESPNATAAPGAPSAMNDGAPAHTDTLAHVQNTPRKPSDTMSAFYEKPPPKTTTAGGSNTCAPGTPRALLNLNQNSDSVNSDSECAWGNSVSVSAEGHAGVQSACFSDLIAILKIPWTDRKLTNAMGKQLRADITSLNRLIANAIRAPDRDNARRQADRLRKLAQEAKSSCGQWPAMAKLMHLAKQEGLYETKESKRAP